RRNDGVEAFADGFGCERAGAASSGSLFQRALRANHVQVAAKVFRFVAFGGRVENDASAHEPSFLKSRPASRGQRKRGVTLPNHYDQIVVIGACPLIPAFSPNGGEGESSPSRRHHKPFNISST